MKLVCAAPATKKNAVFSFNQRHKIQGKRCKLASTSLGSLNLSFTLGKLKKHKDCFSFVEIASREHGRGCHFVYKCCSKAREEFGMGIGLESLNVGKEFVSIDTED